ncbi:hypothetical protein TrCOL_g8954 [Triparma columacea]|uniref:Uncharacterized protein n=1 Tax=Triparma columacea TaxID=722753 RepID=A0A9W7G2S2_9STRA|nr:hypothetical protein TrCOL_g8954 [Triparma columacea]
MAFNSGDMLKAAKNAQRKKVMKGPEIEIDLDALLGGVMGEEKKDNKDEETVDQMDDPDIHGLNKLDNASHGRAGLRENVVDQILSEYAHNPNATVKVKKKKVKRYPCYNCRKFLGCAHVDIHTAVLEGKLGRVRRVVRRLGKKSPTAINEIDENGRTALSLAIKESREDIADLILSSSNSDPDIRDKWTGMAPMHHASHLGLTNTVGKLLWRQADINVVDNNGTTPLMMACAIGNEKMVDLLLEENADAEKRDNYKWNALFYATYGGSIKVVQRILNEGVNKRLKDKKKLMALDWAEHLKSNSAKHGEIAALLENFSIEMSTDKYKSTFG